MNISNFNRRNQFKSSPHLQETAELATLSTAVCSRDTLLPIGVRSAADELKDQERRYRRRHQKA